MALSSNSVWEVRTTGADSNGGGFVTGASGTDRSQQDAAQATLTTASVIHTTTTQINVAVGDFTVSAADVGNIFQLTSGTGTAGFYQITAVDVPNNRWTVDRSVGTAAQTTAGAMGGALASPGKAAGAKVAGNDVWIKAGTYTLTTASANVSGGIVNDTLGGVDPANVSFWQSYTTTRGDRTGYAKILVPASGIMSVTIFAIPAHYVSIEGILADGASKTSIRGISFGGFGIILRCGAENCTNSGIVAANLGVQVIGCYATGCSTAGAAFVVDAPGPVGCEAYANSVKGFENAAITNNVTYTRCLSYANTGASTDGFYTAGYINTYIECIAYGNGRDGIRAATTVLACVDCIIESNGGYGINASSGANQRTILVNTATFGNTSGATNNLTGSINIGAIAATASVFTDAASGDFSLNNTANAGAALRGLGYPSLFPRGLTANYSDIGAAQHLETAGGGTASIFSTPVIRAA